jgi:hypothetical protein
MHDQHEAVAANEAAARPQVTLDELKVGARIRYADAGAAERQATRRATLALAAGEIKPGDLLVLLRIIDLTVSYSKFADRVTRAQLAPAGMSEAAAAKAVTRGCRRLAEAGVVFVRPGRGRGNLTIIGIPPVGKRGHLDVPVPGVKRGHPDVPVSVEKRGRSGTEKGDTHVCAHAGAVSFRSSEKVSEKNDVAHESENIKTRIDEIDSLVDEVLDTLPPDSKSTHDQKALIREAASENPPLLRAVLKDALRVRGYPPIAVLTTRLREAQENGWTSRENPTPLSDDERETAALRWAEGIGALTPEPYLSEDIDHLWTSKGVSEAPIRQAIAETRERLAIPTPTPPTTPSGDFEIPEEVFRRAA